MKSLNTSLRVMIASLFTSTQMILMNGGCVRLLVKFSSLSISNWLLRPSKTWLRTQEIQQFKKPLSKLMITSIIITLSLNISKNMEGKCGSREEERMSFLALDMLVINKPSKRAAINLFYKLTDHDHLQRLNKKF